MDSGGGPRRAYRWRRIKVMSFHIRSALGDVLEVGAGQVEGSVWDVSLAASPDSHLALPGTESAVLCSALQRRKHHAASLSSSGFLSEVRAGGDRPCK